jgi:hypothetical protein
MRGTIEEAANYCGNSSKEEGCEIYESGPLPESKQGHRTDHDEAQKIIIKKAQEGMKFKDLKLLLPRFANQSLKWMRDIYLDNRTVRENFFTIAIHQFSPLMTHSQYGIEGSPDRTSSTQASPNHERACHEPERSDVSGE